jgi:hypothetical protein
MIPVFEPMIPVFERAATVIGHLMLSRVGVTIDGVLIGEWIY